MEKELCSWSTQVRGKVYEVPKHAANVSMEYSLTEVVWKQSWEKLLHKAFNSKDAKLIKECDTIHLLLLIRLIQPVYDIFYFLV